MLKGFAGFCAVIVVYLLAWPVPIEPHAWQAPKAKGFVDEFAPNDKLVGMEYLPLEDSGPEDYAINSQGTIAIALHSGFVGLLEKGQSNVQPWVNTGGRPLGVEFDSQDNLIVADAYLGLLKIDQQGDISVLANQVNNSAILYADDLDIAEDGKVYFSDASTRFGAKASNSTLAASLLDILEHSSNGRILVFDPSTQQTRVLLEGLNFPNGIAVSHDENSLLFNETGTYRVMRYWLTGSNKGQVEVVTDNLPGFPDNLAKGGNGLYWLGLTSPRSPVVDALSDNPFMRKVIQRLPAFIRPKAQRYGHVLSIDEEGNVQQSLQDPSGEYGLTTGVLETEKYLYISSLTEPRMARKRKE